MEREGDATINACSRLGGGIKDGVCLVDGFPTHVNYSDWWGESIIPDSLEQGEALVIHASPEDAQRLFPPTRFYEPSIKQLEDRIKEGKPINPPWLEMCINICKPSEEKCRRTETWVVGHEGRHRIEAARRMGLKKIPIVIRKKPEEYCVD